MVKVIMKLKCEVLKVGFFFFFDWSGYLLKDSDKMLKSLKYKVTPKF